MSREIVRTKNFVADAASLIVDLARKSLAERNEFRIALSGGNTPRPVYAKLAEAGLPWEKVIFTFGDERCVPPNDEQSNYRMARESLFDPAKVPQKSIMRISGENEPKMASQEYEQQLGPNFRHDLILLGMGADGHTASLFPGTAALKETKRRVIENFVPKFDAWRITFTLPFINHARHVCFLVNATEHHELIERVLGGDMQYPSACVNPSAGNLFWVLGE
ncbi:MAG: 6-phosphogluconolactonase [Spartobacteria bacterium]